MGLNFEVVISNPVLTKEINPMHLDGINSRPSSTNLELKKHKEFQNVAYI